MNNYNPNSQPNNTSRDLKAAAEEALRLFKEAQDDIDSEDTTRLQRPVGDSEEIGNTTNDLAQEALKALKMASERQKMLEAAQNATQLPTFTPNMLLQLEMLEDKRVLVVPVQEGATIGRGDNVTEFATEVDLTPFGAYRCGLSRRHAIVFRQDNHLFIKDLNSRNGTFVNGMTIIGGQSQILKDGDEIRLGNLAFRIIFKHQN